MGGSISGSCVGFDLGPTEQLGNFLEFCKSAWAVHVKNFFLKHKLELFFSAINSVNKNLQFTAEVPEDFDFFLWLDKNGLLNHSYFQKSIKTPPGHHANLSHE